MNNFDLSVVVVDDMAVSRGLITHALDWMNILNYRTCADPLEALEMISHRPAHLVISDYYMPSMDGLQLLERIRSMPVLSRTGFILVTGKIDQSIVSRGKSMGLNNLIVKPFTKEKMKECIEKVVSFS